MGLDMFLSCNSKRVCQDAARAKDPETAEWEVQSGVVMYWRKANAIHKWIVDQCFYDEYGRYNGSEIMVYAKTLRELVETCKEVLASSEMEMRTIYDEWYTPEGVKKKPIEFGFMKDTSVAQELLPTQDGFFFGSTDYDQMYVEDLERTVKELEAALENVVQDKKWDFKCRHKEEPDWYVEFRYSASW